MRSFCFTAALVLLAGCSTDDTNPYSPTGPLAGDGEIPGDRGSGEGDGDFGSATSGGAAEDGGDPGVGEPGGGSGEVEPGTLTAGTWDDNQNYDLFLDYRAEVHQSGVAGLLPFSVIEHDAAHAAVAMGPKATLDVSLVIDTTGSMGDEILYLQTELDALATTIATRYPGAEQRWSLVVYRDTTDEYVVRWFDFRDDTADFRARLAEQSVDGGGDFPEAPDKALDVAHRLSWRTGADTARLMFWVADAPHHTENAGALADAIRGTQAKGIHIYPVASSGVDELTELSMRSAAQLTGGRYLFLTDDSGVGGEHKEPTIPCYYVTRLDDAILRMVDIEMKGVYREPTADEVVRVGGDPENGICQLESGDVQAF